MDRRPLLHQTLQHLANVPSPVQELRDDRLAAGGVRLWLKRDDLIHSDLVGNKWRKLRDNLIAADVGGFDTLLTFGGSYSNHVRAMAVAGRMFDFATIGVIRGERRLPLNPSLAVAAASGMRLTYLDRSAYRRKHEQASIAALHRSFGQFYLLPEGGANTLAVRGCAELPAEIGFDYDLLCCPCGTGATLAGIAAGLPAGRRAMGFSVLKGGEFLNAEVVRLQREAYGAATTNWTLATDFHFGGFAKRSAALDAFVEDFRARHAVLLDRIYVAKMMYGIYSLIERGTIRRGARIVAVVTG